MKFSTLKEIKSSNDIVGVFGGYNHNMSSISNGEFYDMKNMTSSYYPALSPRKKRGSFNYPDNSSATHQINGIYSKGSTFIYVDGNYLYINNEKVQGFVLDNNKKQFVSMGSYVVIFPDAKYVNTIDFTDKGSLNRVWDSTTGLITATNCDIEGNNYNIIMRTSSEPQGARDGDCYIDTSGDNATIKQYSSAQQKWKEVEKYVKLVIPGVQSTFEDGDEITISGFNTAAQPYFDFINNHRLTIQKIYTTDSNSTAVVLPGFFDTKDTLGQSTSVSLNAFVPYMDFVVENGNRLWGCRYGLDREGNFVNEIYACKLGDFRTWNSFKGISTDSYTASCGSDGEFTGAIVHLGYPLFFKENCLHKVYGNYPSNYQIQTTACRGVMKGAAGSLAIVNENLMYKSRNGVCAYDGSLPKEISTALGEVRYTAVDDTMTDKLRNGAVAGFFQNKYYISMKSEVDSKWHLFVYDVSYGLWHKEDNTRVDMFCPYTDDLYYIDNSTKGIKTMLGTCVKDTRPVEWMAETGVIGVKLKENKYTVSLIGKKYISQLLMRMSLDIGSRVYFYIQYDSVGEWEPIATLLGTTLKSFNVPIRPKRCDHFRLRIVGTGDAKIYSMSRSIEQGSDF